MQVSDVLKEKGRDVITISSDATILDAAKLLAKSRIGALIVADGKKGLAGILSERDIVRAFAAGAASAAELTVAECMTKNVAACMEADTIQEIMDIMTRCRFRHMPVLDKGQITGIVSIGDIAKTRFRSRAR